MPSFIPSGHFRFEVLTVSLIQFKELLALSTSTERSRRPHPIFLRFRHSKPSDEKTGFAMPNAQFCRFALAGLLTCLRSWPHVSEVLPWQPVKEDPDQRHELNSVKLAFSDMA